jgi:hypothetical protein
MDKSDLAVALGFLGASSVLVSIAFKPAPALMAKQKARGTEADITAAKGLSSVTQSQQAEAAGQPNPPAPADKGAQCPKP